MYTEILPDLRKRDPEGQRPLPGPEDVFALCMWVEQPGRAFQLPMEGGFRPPPLFTAYNLSDQRIANLFMDDGNVPKIIQTLVDAKQSIIRRSHWPTNKALELAQKFWKELLVAELDIFLTDEALLRLEAWELEWYPDPNLDSTSDPRPNHIRQRRCYFWRMLQRCSERMITVSSSLNWSTQLEKNWLKSETNNLVEEMRANPPPAKRRRSKLNLSCTTVTVEAPGLHAQVGHGTDHRRKALTACLEMLGSQRLGKNYRQSLGQATQELQ